MRRYLSWRATVGWAVGGLASFHLAYEVPALGGLAIVYLAAVFMLARVASVRVAFWLGLGLGLAVVAPQLAFFWRIFKVAAIPLWMILALYLALYLATARACLERWPRYGVLALPVLWTGLEYFRSELYYLRFAWLSPGLAMSYPRWSWLLVYGAFGTSFAILGLLAAGSLWRVSWRWRAATVLLALGLAAGLLFRGQSPGDGPVVAGVQFEFVQESQLVRGLDKALAVFPESEMLVLSEYAFQGPVPPEMADWCRRHGKYLVAGGKEPVSPGSETWYNMAFVVDPRGEVVFRQAKSVPIQFFDDGEPAPGQAVWESPWGAIGIAICYDLSYTRVMDELVRQGARALIVPTMDVEEWGERQHRLHARPAPARAREYGIPIFRVCSSGESQLVTSNGRVVATAGVFGQGEVLGGRLGLSPRARLPLDRHLAPLSVAGVAVVWFLLGWSTWRRPHDRGAGR